jgi:hypothetical protein
MDDVKTVDPFQMSSMKKTRPSAFTKKNESNLRTTTNQFQSKQDESFTSDRRKDFHELKINTQLDDLNKPIMVNDEEAANLSENSNYNLDLNISEFNDSVGNKPEMFKHPYKDVSNCFNFSMKMVV